MTILMALLAGVASGSLILLDRYQDPLSFGLPMVAAGLASVIAGALFQSTSIDAAGASRARFAARVAERLADAAILGAVAWVAVNPPSGPYILSSPDRWLAAAALTALGMAYLASYVRAKATGLGFRVTELPGERLVHYGLIGAGLLMWGSTLEAMFPVALWLAASVSAVDLTRGARAVARQEEPT